MKIATIKPDISKRTYFVAETKGTEATEVNSVKLIESEQLKIKCGKTYFNEFEGIEYKSVNKAG